MKFILLAAFLLSHGLIAQDLGSSGGGAAAGAFLNWWLSQGGSESSDSRPKPKPSILDLGVGLGTPAIGQLVIQKRFENSLGLRASGGIFPNGNGGAQLSLLKSFNDFWGISLLGGFNYFNGLSPYMTYYGAALDLHLGGFYFELGTAYYSRRERTLNTIEEKFEWLPCLQLGYLWRLG